jgi:tetratricopeptide (TPR) repeat protein/DNA-binding CsgD family transcriptional regulator
MYKTNQHFVLSFLFLLISQFCFSIYEVETDSLRLSTQSNTLSAEDVTKIHLQLSYAYNEQNELEKAILELDNGFVHLKNSQFYALETSYYIQYAVLYGKMNQLELSLKNNLLALKTYKKVKHKTNQMEASIYFELGITYNEINNYKLSSKYLNKALSLYGKRDSVNTAYCYINIGALEGNFKNYENALKYLQLSLEYLPKSKAYYIDKAIIFNNIGLSYLEIDNLEFAFQNLTKSIEILDHLPEKIVYTNYIGIHHAFSRLFIKKKDFNNALKHNEIAEKIAKNHKIIHFLGDTYENYVSIYKLSNNPIKTSFYLELLLKEQERIHNENLSLKLSEEKQKFDLEHIQLENRNKLKSLAQEKRILQLKWITTIGVILILLLIVSILLYRHKLKSKLIRIKLEKEALEKKHLNEKLQFKNKEATAFAMHILNKNDFLDDLKKKLKAGEFGINNQDLIQLTQLLNQNTANDQEKKELEIKVKEVNESFLFNLSKKFPELNEREKKLCCYLLLNFTSKEIAELMNITLKSAEQSRSRLRKKLEIGSDVDLSDFLAGI